MKGLNSPQALCNEKKGEILMGQAHASTCVLKQNAQRIGTAVARNGASRIGFNDLIKIKQYAFGVIVYKAVRI